MLVESQFSLKDLKGVLQVTDDMLDWGEDDRIQNCTPGWRGKMKNYTKIGTLFHRYK